MWLKIELIGNVGRNPELRTAPNGNRVASFTVATNRIFIDKNGARNKETTWFRITCWNDLAKFVSQHVKKSDIVFVEGRLDCDPETGGPILHTKANGEIASQFEITANTIKNITYKNNDMDEKEI